MKKKSNIRAIKPSEVPFARYDHPDGSIAIYLPRGYDKELTVQRANFLLDMAKRRLLDEYTHGWGQ